MCPPVYFAVSYSINPWMDPAVPVDRDRALAQWQRLVEAYRACGHLVELLAPVPGLPDMVFAANGASVIDGEVIVARFSSSWRSAEADHHASWHRAANPGVDSHTTRSVNEAEGDVAVLSDRVLAGFGFRTSRQAHRELADLTHRQVISLELVDPRFYHLDLALTVLDDDGDQIAYYPPAFSAESRALLATLFPDAVLASSADAYAFGLNAVSDGLHVFLPVGADRLADALAATGYRPVPIDLSELAKGGGSVKCCTQELRCRPGRGEPEER
jgi:N-dimethylarginine dimethylaminohydrolase